MTESQNSCHCREVHCFTDIVYFKKQKLSELKWVKLKSFKVLTEGLSATFKNMIRLNEELVKCDSDMQHDVVDYSKTYKGIIKTEADFIETDVDLSKLYEDIIRTEDQFNDMRQYKR